MNRSSGDSLYKPRRRGYAARRERRMVEQLDAFFWKCYFMLRMNRVEGDYLEFGAGGRMRSFRLAYKYRQLEYSGPRLFAFDSFKGLPAPKGIDRHPQWQEGALKLSQRQFHARMREVGARRSDYQVVPGFFEETLKGRRPSDYGIRKAAMVFVDCDLYASADRVLRFVGRRLAEGAVLAFDDWFCFGGDPDRGEQRAFREYRRRVRSLAFTEYLPFGWHGMSFIAHIHRPKKRMSGGKKQRNV